MIFVFKNKGMNDSKKRKYNKVGQESVDFIFNQQLKLNEPFLKASASTLPEVVDDDYFQLFDDFENDPVVLASLDIHDPLPEVSIETENNHLQRRLDQLLNEKYANEGEIAIIRKNLEKVILNMIADRTGKL